MCAKLLIYDYNLPATIVLPASQAVGLDSFLSMTLLCEYTLYIGLGKLPRSRLRYNVSVYQVVYGVYCV